MKGQKAVLPDAAFSIDREQLKILRHSLGLDELGHGLEYRNYFATDPSSADGAHCKKLCDQGWMLDLGSCLAWSKMHVYEVTYKGRRVIELHQPFQPRVSPGRRRYLDFLHADSGLSFIEWLKRNRRAA